MEIKNILVDTNKLIEHYRKTEKEESLLFDQLVTYECVFISSVTVFEVMVGAFGEQVIYWYRFLNFFSVIDFESRTACKAAIVMQQLKKKRKTIEKADLFIAATAVTHDLIFDTSNKKDFEHIEGLRLLQ